MKKYNVYKVETGSQGLGEGIPCIGYLEDRIIMKFHLQKARGLPDRDEIYELEYKNIDKLELAPSSITRNEFTIEKKFVRIPVEELAIIFIYENYMEDVGPWSEEYIAGPFIERVKMPDIEVGRPPYGGPNVFLSTIAITLQTVCYRYFLYGNFNTGDTRRKAEITQAIQAMQERILCTEYGLYYAKNWQTEGFNFHPITMYCLNCLNEFFCFCEDDEIDDLLELLKYALATILQEEKKDLDNKRIRDAGDFFGKLSDAARQYDFNGGD